MCAAMHPEIVRKISSVFVWREGSINVHWSYRSSYFRFRCCWTRSAMVCRSVMPLETYDLWISTPWFHTKPPVLVARNALTRFSLADLTQWPQSDWSTIPSLLLWDKVRMHVRGTVLGTFPDLPERAAIPCSDGRIYLERSVPGARD